MSSEAKRRANRKWRANNKNRVQQYNKNWRTNPDNLERRRANGRNWYRRHKVLQRERDLLRIYGLSKTEYDNLLKNQDGKCAICGKLSLRSLDVDHCHKTGKVRGLLCNPCNVRLAILENSGFVDRAKLYLGVEGL
jgi:hypothetical protein